MTLQVDFPFRDLDIATSYSSSFSDMLEDFYIPVLERSSEYRRASGYFSSAVVTAIEVALTGFLSHGGKIRLICSPKMTAEDAKAITEGAKERAIGNLLNSELDAVDSSIGSNAPSSIVRSLIARGVLEIRIAIKSFGGGMFHDKYGILSAPDGDYLAFDGSINETMAGWSAYGNHESFQVFASWDNRVSDRALELSTRFDRTWNGESKALNIFTADRLPEVFSPRDSDIPEAEAIAHFINARRFRVPSNKRGSPKPKELQDHQRAALSNWAHAEMRGIISFVTGGGKTITALSAARDWLAAGKPVVVLVPSEILVEQWIDEARSELGDVPYSLVQVGAGKSIDWWFPRVSDALDPDLRLPPCLVIGTYASAQIEAFLLAVEKREQDLLLICDEVHSIGAPNSWKIMDRIQAMGRLGLSATPERFNDVAGTERIFEYFGEKLEPAFGIAEAIAAGRLVPYSYNLYNAFLSTEETEKFDDLTIKIKQLAARNSADISQNEYLEKLLRDRANLVKEAESKIDVALEILEAKRHLYSHWLLYCNSLAQVELLRQSLQTQDINPLQYHSYLTRGERRATLEYFTTYGGVLLAVHCLDQGVDIPRIDAAIILASSVNPREYIQRRGRILRASPNKQFADLNDIVTLTSNQCLALRSEIDRAQEIGAHASNQRDVTPTIEYLKSTIGDINYLPIEEDLSGN